MLFRSGLNATFGAVGHWGAADVGWGATSNVVVGRWTYVAYTYAGTTMTATVYRDGAVANSRVLAAALNTWDIENTTLGPPLPFRLGSQNDANGTPTAALRGSMSIARLRVYDGVLSASAIAANYSSEVGFFTAAPAPTMQSPALNPQTGVFSFTWTVAPGKTYAVEASSSLSGWAAVATGLSSGNFSTNVVTSGGRYYRLKVE